MVATPEVLLNCSCCKVGAQMMRKALCVEKGEMPSENRPSLHPHRLLLLQAAGCLLLGQPGLFLQVSETMQVRVLPQCGLGRDCLAG